MVPSEVAIMLMLEEESIHSDGKAPPVALLDWYEIGEEILLVMERPIPCEDLLHYLDTKGGTLQEEEAKIIMKQLIRTAIDLEDRNIFHQDIKTNNILIQTHTNTPQARLIDFGVSCMAEKDSILRYSGTPINAPPEAFRGFCRPGTTTVWQLGVVLYETLHYCNFFSTKHFLQGDQMIDDELSEGKKLSVYAWMLGLRPSSLLYFTFSRVPRLLQSMFKYLRRTAPQPARSPPPSMAQINTHTHTNPHTHTHQPTHTHTHTGTENSKV
uniref:non-specific serine/threonine protein kinase n=1 Tax=Oryzias sinensis TaxID=183150 RepID=A0A8C7XDV6_9TELE